MNQAGTFVAILTGVSKTLGVAREVIPLYQQTKPLIKNVRSAYSLIKNVNSSNIKNSITPKTNVVKNEEVITKLPEKTIIKSNNSPQFFI